MSPISYSLQFSNPSLSDKELAPIVLSYVESNDFGLPCRIKDKEGKKCALVHRDVFEKLWVTFYQSKEASKVPFITKGTDKIRTFTISYCEDGSVRDASKILRILYNDRDDQAEKITLYQEKALFHASYNGLKGIPERHADFIYPSSHKGKECIKLVSLQESCQGSLKTYVQKQDSLEKKEERFKKYYFYLKDALLSLSEVHDKKVLLGNIVGGNVLIGSGERKVVFDFSMAESLENLEDLNKKLRLMKSGQLTLISPERFLISTNPKGVDQELLKNVKLESDVWSLGIIFYLILNEEPHEASKVFAKILEAPKLAENEWSPGEEDEKRALIKKAYYFIDSYRESYKTLEYKTGIDGLIQKMLHPEYKKRITAEDAYWEFLQLSSNLDG